MAKLGLDGNRCQSILAHRCNFSGWVLCVGAGTSLPAFPSWNELTVNLLHSVSPNIKVDIADFKTYSPDACIQAIHNISKLDSNAFARKLSVALYGKLLKSLTTAQYNLIVKALVAISPEKLSKAEWEDFCSIIEAKYPELSALLIADVICESVDRNLAPNSILSFNAEPMLFSLLTAKRFRQSNKKMFARVTSSISSIRPRHIPYIHCHGLLPVPGAKKLKGTTNHGAIDKLVFSEAEYLNLANSNFSWQATKFLEACSSSSVVFVGVSLSDPNMRRWLTWGHHNRIMELDSQNLKHSESTNHYWLTVKPPERGDNQRYMEAMVEHLGVRIIWLDSWNDTGKVLRKMLG